MKHQNIDVTIRNAAPDDKSLMPAGQLRASKDNDGFHFYPHYNLLCLSASDLEGIARMIRAANDLVRE